MTLPIKGILGRLERALRSRQAYRFFIRDWARPLDLDAAADVLATMRFTHNLRPLLVEVPRHKRILVLAPHPDDELIGPGGTLAKAVSRQCTVRTLYLTSGSENPEICAEREGEAMAAGEAIGFSTEFLREQLSESADVRLVAQRLAERVSKFDPELVMVTFLLDDHPEHRCASKLLYLAFKTGQLAADLDVWAYQVYSAVIPNVVVDITDVADRKAAAIRLFESQMKSRDWAHYALGLNAWNSRFVSGEPIPRHIEAFFRVPLGDYASLCEQYFENTAVSAGSSAQPGPV